MERPSWATIAGILLIVFGVFGLLAGGQLLIMPTVLEFQKEMFSGMEEAFAEQAAKDPGKAPPKAMMDMMETMWDMPPWFASFSVGMGLLSLLGMGYYIFAGIRMLQVVPTSIQHAYQALGLAIGLGAVKTIGGIVSMSFMSMGLVMGGLFGLVIDTVLLAVIVTGDKSAYAEETSTNTGLA